MNKNEAITYVADFIIHLHIEDNEPLSSAKLNTMVFVVNGYYYKEFGTFLAEEKFVRYSMYPVLPSVWHDATQQLRLGIKDYPSDRLKKSQKYMVEHRFLLGVVMKVYREFKYFSDGRCRRFLDEVFNLDKYPASSKIPTIDIAAAFVQAPDPNLVDSYDSKSEINKPCWEIGTNSIEIAMLTLKINKSMSYPMNLNVYDINRFLFLLQCHSVGDGNGLLINEPFYPVKFGPALMSVYYRFGISGILPIVATRFDFDKYDLDVHPHKDFVERYIIHYSKTESYELRELTMRDGGIWSKMPHVEPKFVGSKIPEESFMEEYLWLTRQKN